jgi:transcriptional regulator with XRE-family HTH domain
LTQEELAKELFVSRTAISKGESGRGYPNIDSLKEISRYFTVSIDELICPDEIISNRSTTTPSPKTQALGKTPRA